MFTAPLGAMYIVRCDGVLDDRPSLFPQSPVIVLSVQNRYKRTVLGLPLNVSVKFCELLLL